MKKAFLSAAAIGVVMLLSALVQAGSVTTNIELRQVRDPVQFKDVWDSTISTLAAGTNMPATGVTTNISAAAYATNIVAAAPLTNVTGLAAFCTNIVWTYATNDVLLKDGSTQTIISVTSGQLQKATPAVQVGAAPTLQKATPTAQNTTP